jgi:uncharacterized iron-regulated membrane protein
MTKKTKQRIIDFFVVTHQWSGFVLSIMFFVWFISGFVLMYKDFPYIQQAEIIEKTKAWEVGQSLLPPPAFLPDSLQNQKLGITLTTQMGRPLYRIITPGGAAMSFFGDDGSFFTQITEEQALAIVSDFEGKEVQAQAVVLDDWLDQWTPRTRFIPYLPWYKVKADDGKGTVYYVSSINGEINQKLNLEDKVWAWLGAIPHWIYFKDLRITTQKWRDVVVALSIAGVLMSITGIVIGIIRVKKNRGMKFSPYKKFWFKWHHYTGFIFGLFVFTFILSGLFSMNPWRWSPPKSLNTEENQRWEGASFNVALVPDQVAEIVSAMAGQGALKQVEFGVFDGQMLLRGQYGDRKPVMAKVMGEAYALIDKLPRQQVEEKLTATLGMPVAHFEELEVYDKYYIDKWKKRPLPVYKASFGDEQGTLVYVDPHMAKVVYKYTTVNKWERWLYHGLHSFDFPFLLKYRPLWDIVMWLMGLGGLAVSITGVVLTWRWLKRKVTHPRPRGYRAKIKKALQNQ